MSRLLALALLAVLPACATTEEGSGAGSAPARPASQAASYRDSDRVGGIQLFGGNSETNPPITDLDGSQPLTLAFDVLDTDGRPLSVWYYQTDQAGRINPFSSNLIEGFEREDLIQYQVSRGTRPPYNHYATQVPSTSTRFTVSGRYLLRVTELGQENAVLFERTFYVAERGVEAEMTTEELYQGGRTNTLLPLVRVTTDGLNPDPFYYSACFAQDGHLEALRCTSRPLLVQPRAITFQVPPELAFVRDNATHYLDLRGLRASTEVERIDLDAPVPAVRLAPDEPAFPDVTFPNLLAQPVLGDVRVAGDPGTSADYVDVTFQMTPPGDAPLVDAYLTGSFSNWQPRAVAMTWNAETRRYAAMLRLKQGQYEYRYTSSDPRFQRTVAGALGRADSRYTAFVFYRDQQRQADRLLAIRNLTAP